MECHGGAGYVEESILPRLFRQSPLNSIWEGSGNVICLDVLRALTREPETADALFAELDKARGHHTTLDRTIDEANGRLAKTTEPDARRTVETLALALQAALLVRHAPNVVADAFIATRLAEPWRTYGAFDAEVEVGAVLSRAMPTD
jgi:putative acyl-CoA dehydrogenase